MKQTRHENARSNGQTIKECDAIAIARLAKKKMTNGLQNFLTALTLPKTFGFFILARNLAFKKFRNINEIMTIVEQLFARNRFFKLNFDLAPDKTGQSVFLAT